MSANLYAPPQSHVRDVMPAYVAPRLWNPIAAVRWSLLLTPAFGAWLHMKNWQALGDLQRARIARIWVGISILFPVGVGIGALLAPHSRVIDAMSRVSGFALLAAWYFSAGRVQQAYVASTYADDYEHRSWGKPLFIALLMILALFAVLFALLFSAQMFTIRI